MRHLRHRRRDLSTAPPDTDQRGATFYCDRRLPNCFAVQHSCHFASFTGRSAGWSAYTPLTNSPVGIANFSASQPYDRWTDPEFWSMIAFAMVLFAAVAEAISARQVLPGIATIAAPCVALGLLLLATPGTLDSVEFDTMSAMSVVLVAIAVREVWARRFAPRPTLPT